MKNNELVLVFKTELLRNIGIFNGFTAEYSRYIDTILNADNTVFMPRSKAETDVSCKQIIPYVLMEYNGKFLYYVRGKQSGESRLVSKASIGIGGHINPVDETLFSDTKFGKGTYFNAVNREVSEEIVMETKYRDTIAGIINDDTADVGKVHFGIVHLWKLEQPKVSKREQNITQLEFLSPEEIMKRKDSLESWSQICAENIINKIIIIY